MISLHYECVLTVLYLFETYNISGINVSPWYKLTAASTNLAFFESKGSQ